MRGVADASHCRVIAENGQGVTWTCQHHFYTGCSSPAIVNAVTNRMWSRNFRLMRLYTSPPQLCCVESLAIAFAVRRFRRSPFFAIRSVCRAAMGDSSRTVDPRTKRIQPHGTMSLHANGPTRSEKSRQKPKPVGDNGMWHGRESHLPRNYQERPPNVQAQIQQGIGGV